MLKNRQSFKKKLYQVIQSELLPLARASVGLRGAMLGRGRGEKKIDANIWIVCVTIVVLQPFSYTVSLCSTPVYSESDTHPLSIVCCADCHYWLKVYPMLQKPFLFLTIIF